MHDQGQGVNWPVVQQKNHLITRTDEFGNFCEIVGFVPSRDYFVCNRRPHNFGRLGLDWIGGRSVLTYSKLANPELRLLSLSKKSAIISLRDSVHVSITRFEASPEVSR